MPSQFFLSSSTPVTGEQPNPPFPPPPPEDLVDLMNFVWMKHNSWDWTRGQSRSGQLCSGQIMEAAKVEGNMLDVSMFECDGFERRGDPSDSQGLALEYNALKKFCCSEEVNPTRHRFTSTCGFRSYISRCLGSEAKKLKGTRTRRHQLRDIAEISSLTTRVLGSEGPSPTNPGTCRLFC